LLRADLAQGRPGLRRRQFPRAVREHRARADAQRGRGSRQGARMLERLCFGELPAKPHTALRGPDGRLRYESCSTRQGFDGPFTIAYHLERPQALEAAGDPLAVPLALEGRPGSEPPRAPRPGFARRHYRTNELPSEHAGASTPLLYNADLVIGCRKPTRDDTSYHLNAGADELLFVQSGSGTVRTPLGDLDFRAGDYVCLPKGILYRLLIDAPYSHRDFRRPAFLGPRDEGLREVWVKAGETRQRFLYGHSPLDVV